MRTRTNFDNLVSKATTIVALSRRFSIRRIPAEISKRDEQLLDCFDEDKQQYRANRNLLREALAKNPVDEDLRASDLATNEAQQASFWIPFLRTEIELIDFRAGYYGNLAVYTGGGVALLIVVSNGLSTNWGRWLAVFTALFPMGFAVVRHLIERRKAWYKYLLSQLEIIKASNLGAS